ncbi:MAG TPA: PIG-L family deacetylase [Acidobacteriaceae bacterium]|nr:PIG-L family deacetylase [Acidobacteriaceae bacterium]
MSWSLLSQATAQEGSASPMPRAMLVFAHPDDEVVGLGARLGRFGGACFVHVTDGAPKNGQDSRAHGFATVDDYRRAREKELSRALAGAGLQNVRRERLGIADQEASLQLAWLVRRIERIMVECMPEVAFTHPYEGGHPDHDACAFAVHKAVGLLNARGAATPVILEAAFYHAGPHGGEAGAFLPHSAETEHVEYLLSGEERRRKQALLDCYETQRETLSGFPLDYEHFRVAPQYDFHQPPHEGQVLYDQYPWGMTSERFRTLAAAADEELAQWQ